MSASIRSLLLLAGLSLGSATAHAAVLNTTTADAATLGPNGADIDGNAPGQTNLGVNATNVASARVGTLTGNANQRGRAFVIPFSVAAIPAGQTFDAAGFTAYYSPVAGVAYPTAYNADLYGLGARAATTVLATDFYQGPDDLTNATKLQDEFSAPVTPAPVDGESVTTNAAGNAGLLAYLNAALAAYRAAETATPGSGLPFVFLRINADGNSGATNNGYIYSTFDVAPLNGVPQGPFITYTTVPEPAALAVIGVAGAAVLRRRRQV